MKQNDSRRLPICIVKSSILPSNDVNIKIFFIFRKKLNSKCSNDAHSKHFLTNNKLHFMLLEREFFQFH